MDYLELQLLAWKEAKHSKDLPLRGEAKSVAKLPRTL